MEEESKLPGILKGLKRLFEHELNPELKKCVNTLLNEASLSNVVVGLSKHIIDFNQTVLIFQCLPQIRTDIVSAALENEEDHRIKYILLGKLFHVQKGSVQSFLVHFNHDKSPWFNPVSHSAKVAKKRKTVKKIEDLDTVECCWNLLRSSFVHFKDKWNWAEFMKIYLHHEDHQIVWVACQCASKLLGTDEIVRKYLTVEEDQKFSFLYSKQYSNDEFLFDDPISLDFDVEGKSDYPLNSKSTVNVGGISLPVFNTENQDTSGCLISVKSTEENLRNIALGISTSKAVCLFGIVGSGKTALVEHLAKITGRLNNKELLKVQLGEETDSKLLLGTYKCTDLPGEFIWESGVLTKAILGGHWLLIEDIESASSDIAALLAGLLENNVVNIPGFRDNVRVSPGFQLFMTHRLLPGLHSNHKKQTGATELLEKYWLQVNLEPLSYDELVHIIQVKFPLLKTIADRMVKVYTMFTSGNQDSSGTNEILLRQTGRRIISVRDLMKWCMRAEIDFDVSSQNSALKVLNDAIDLFCCSYQNLAVRLELASSVSACLGIIKTKAEYFCIIHKPNVTLTDTICTAGRAVLPRIKNDDLVLSSSHESKFAFTHESSRLVERIGMCLSLNEPVLLVGETGTGKTSTIQLLAQKTGHKLIVINMNQQSDSSDLLGGYKPVDIKHIITPLRNEFEDLFRSFFNVEENTKFLENISVCMSKRMWLTLLKLMSHSQAAALKRLSGQKNKKEVISSWKNLGDKIFRLKSQLERNKSIMAFSFIEGSLVKALKQGDWVLLDEINLASAETLQCLSGLLEGSTGSVSLLERGDTVQVQRNPNFRLLAAMNPATDFGKKDLPLGIRNRFTELFVAEQTERSDLALLVQCYLPNLITSKIESVVQFYLNVRKRASETLSDSTGQKPLFSLRTLCRGLTIASEQKCGSAIRSLYEALCLSFLTQLNAKSHDIVKNMIAMSVLDKTGAKSILSQSIPEPSSGKHICFEGYWVPKGPNKSKIPEKYLLTSSVRKNLCDIARCVSLSNHPVLIQGETSVGKTSLITYLAESSGHKCFRINNHQHTDLQEYVGSYCADATSGNLIFREGVLVEAMRHGHWIILDELNLAPSEVLEALNRVLDDNRELFIPETQTIVKAHPNFRLFATQNPPGLYGGRKMLSKAFRNRFVELHFDEIPPPELVSILQHRCDMPESYAKKLVAVMSDLQIRRKGSAAFAGKQGFITLRDLFRWGERYRLAINTEQHKYYDWDQHIADEGFLVLAGRVRKEEERDTIRAVIEKHIKRTVHLDLLFTLNSKTSSVTKPILEKILNSDMPNEFKHIVWTYNIRKLAVLVGKALQFSEPVLLVGETGCGKTSVCQLLAAINGQNLFSLNCHQNSESSDFLGGLRPVRNKTEQNDKMFEWIDGPLIESMKGGHVFLADEISLADDSVLERLNSLLEPERKLLVSEKGFGDEIEITAGPDFRFVGTMNPGGDFGKKELSPALRNRLTEIWCEPPSTDEDLISIIEHNIHTGLLLANQQDGSSGIGKTMVQFIKWFKTTEIGKRISISVRDILTWVNFINLVTHNDRLDVATAYIHGACLTLIDGIGTASTAMENSDLLTALKSTCENYLLKQVEVLDKLSTNLTVSNTDKLFGIHPFYIRKEPMTSGQIDFSFEAPTTCLNTLRLIRSLQIPSRAILLEGSPGVGKTSVVIALAKATGNMVTRINLSEQTDVSDLFGADLPVEGAPGGTFAWRDGPFLKALKEGHWILLDELNLASQSVVEGLNSVLDHRGEIFIPELGKTFKLQKGSSRIFGCQNPQRQGGSRKGLPQSFLNRFTQVFMESLTQKDFQIILHGLYPRVDDDLIEKMVEFNVQLNTKIKSEWEFRNGPWEWNLRDLIHWMQTIEDNNPGTFVKTVFIDRLRREDDRNQVIDLYKKIFEPKYPICDMTPPIIINKGNVIFGEVSLPRTSQFDSVRFTVDKNNELLILRSQLSLLRSLALNVKMGWLSILVGESYSGKSSSVYTLAHLLGQKVYTIPISSATDTTELLGGFEQTDYGRHLDSISQQVENYVTLTAQKCILDDKFKECEKLTDAWYNYIQSSYIGDTQELTLVKALDIFNTRIDKINRILDLLPSEISDVLKGKLKHLKTNVDKNGLKAGGTFEWVDSILTKCLEEGNWLIIDNVNLCSGAVLDRLNGLLERDGVLTLSERGVGPEGEIVIRPHPNFRLFFTMDPKNGQISRAMRNRGIEIYVDSPSVKSLNPFDLDCLLNSLGLKSFNHKKAVIHIHDKISEESHGPEEPRVNHLLSAVFLAVQHWNRGTSLSSSIKTSFTEIYIKSRTLTKEHSLRQKEALLNAIDDMKINLDETGCTTPDCFRSDLKTLSTLNIQENVILSSIKHQGSFLHSILKLLETVTKSKQLSKNLSSYNLSDLIGYDLSVLNDGHLLDLEYKILDTLPFIIISFYNLASQDTQCRLEWLNNVIETTQKTPITQYICDKIIHISDIVVKVLNNINKKNVPWDERNYSKQIKNKDWSEENKMYALICYKVVMADHLNDEMNVKNINWRSITILQYSNAVKKGIISNLPTNLTLICEIGTFFNEFDNVVHHILTSKYTTMTTERVCLWLYNVAWKFRFANIANRRLFSGKENTSMHNIPPVSDDSVMLLILHYKWFRKNTLPLLLEMVQQHHTLEEISRPLLKLVDRIDKSINIGKIHLVPLTRKFTRLIQPPLPLRSTEQCSYNKQLYKFSDILEFWKPDVHNVQSFKKSTNFLASPDGKTVRNKIIRCAEFVFHDKILPRAEDTFKDTEILLECIEEREATLSELATVKMWPLEELICLQLNTSLRRYISGHSDVFFNLVSSSAQTWMEKVGSTCPISSGIIGSILNNRDKTHQGQLLFLLMRQMNTSNAVRNPILCLKWEEYQDLDDIEGFNKKDYFTLNSPLYSLFMSNLVSSMSEHSLTFALKSHKITSKMVTFMKSLLWRNLPAIFSQCLDVEINDAQCLKNSYQMLVINLRKSLLIKESEDFDLTDVIENLNKLSSYDPDKLKGISTSDRGQTSIITSIVKCIKSLSQTISQIETSEDLKQGILVGKGCALLGLTNMLLFSNFETVDPVQKKSLKRQYALEEFKELKMYLCVESLNKAILGDTNDWPFKQPHEVRIKYLENKGEDLGKAVAVRPCPSLYNNIVKDVQNLVSYLISNDKLQILLDQFGSKNEQLISNARSWVTSIRTFNEKLYRDYYSTYPDIVTSPLLASSQLIYGLDSAICNTVKQTVQENSSVQECLMQMSSFPIQDVDAAIEIMRTCCSENIVTLIEKYSDEKYVGSTSKLRLAKICVRLVKTINKTNSVNLVTGEFIKVLDFVVQSWLKLQEDTKIKIAQEQSIYINKMTPIQIEEEETKRSVAEMFPTHRDKDFGDLDEPKSLDDPPVEVEPQDPKDNQLNLDMQDIKDICFIHSHIVSTHKNNPWLVKTKEYENESNDRQLLFERMNIFFNLINRLYLACNRELDRVSIPGLITVANLPLMDTTEHTVDKVYNFYRDSNIEEAKQCISLMNAIMDKVGELLEEWSEHPTLNQIKMVVERVIGFEITSPLSRFLTGLELLLTKLHEWEENAHSKVSLAQHAASLTNQIISWRKLELSAWKGALTSVSIKCKEDCSKWWFHIYSLVSSFINSEEKESLEEFVSSLQQFMERSSLGEYSTRLQLLLTFHQHCLIMPKSDKQITAANIFWNLHNFYKLFDELVSKKIKELSIPIEKKLKDFVKIARWNDINYWSIKAAVEKTHNTIHKHVKEFEKLLKDPASVAMVKLTELGHISEMKFPKLDIKNYTTNINVLEDYKDQESTEEHLHRLDSLARKSKRICKNSIEKCGYTKLLEDLSFFVSEVIETGKLINEFDLDPSLPEDKKKSAAKALLQRKRKAISDVFKTLTQLGLMYRSGILMYERKNIDFAIQPPLDIRCSLQQIDTRLGDKDLMLSWFHAEEIYFTSVALSAQLKTVLDKPHKDLGPQFSERIKGFTSHFSKLLHDVKDSLGINSYKLMLLRCQLAQLKDSSVDKCGSVDKNIDKFKVDLKKIFDDILFCLPQFLMVLNACPTQERQSSDLSETPFIFPPDLSNKMVNAFKFDEEWEETKFKIKNIITTCSRLNDKLFKCEKHRNFASDICTDSGVDVITSVVFNDFIQNCYEKLTTVCIDLENVQSSFSMNLDTETCSNPLVNSLENLTFKIKLTIDEYKEYNKPKSTITGHYKNFESKVQNVVHKSLIALQNIYKKYSETEEPKDEFLVDGHIKEKIVENIISDIDKLNLKEITSNLSDIFNSLTQIQDEQEIKDSQILLRNCLPIFDQVTCISQYFITQETLSLKVMSRLQSSLLHLFIDFGRNGYNIPEELVEDGEGESEETKGGMGLGEGEGEKDVSDQIESLDQLEDAKKPGEYGKEEEKDCKEEEKGINMDEDIGGNLQDVEKKDDEDKSGDESDGDEPDKEMGDTEPGAETLDKEVWGSDSEEEEDEEKEKPKDEEGTRGAEQTEKELGAKDDDDQDPTEDKHDGKREEKKEEINEMEEKGTDEEQIDPYHGNLPPSPEVEPLDLGDDEMDVDDDISDKSDNEGENPFDIDQMKEKMPDIEENEEEEKAETDEEEKGGEDKDEEFEKPHLKKDEEEEKDGSEDDEKADKGEIDEKLPEEPEEPKEQEAMEVDKATESLAEPSQQNETAKDKVSGDQDLESANLDPLETKGKDKSGSGTAEKSTKDDGGHAGRQGQKKNDGTSEKEDKRQRPGESDIERSLGDVNEPAKKKMKTIGVQDENLKEQEEKPDETAEHSEDADVYQHIHKSKETNYDTQIIDAATQEQAEKKPVPNKDDEEVGENDKEPMELDEDDITPDEVHPEKKPEKLGDKHKEKKETGKKGDGEALEEATVQVEGEIVPTAHVARGSESTYHTRLEALAVENLLSDNHLNLLREELENQLASWSQPPAGEEAISAWEKLSTVTSSLARDLSEQLRLVLEPTTASGLKGDFRTGRRINMRKVIPYIASEFRKDKIWLRRSKPSKREYQIVLAIDDSSSMSDNHSKELAFESLALVSKALNLLEAGDLGVLSFGETIKVLHELGDPFTEQSGARLLQHFSFDQKRTKIGALVDSAVSLLTTSSRQTDADVAQLLLIVSDGRGVMSEGEASVIASVRKAKLQKVFMVFVIIDNPDSKDSILDIRLPCFKDGKLLGITSYMDSFPFPFYLILRDINNLPSVLSDALRQWFELVTNTRS